MIYVSSVAFLHPHVVLSTSHPTHKNEPAPPSHTHQHRCVRHIKFVFIRLGLKFVETGEKRDIDLPFVSGWKLYFFSPNLSHRIEEKRKMLKNET